MAVTLEGHLLGEVPVLLAHRAAAETAAERGTILIFHGLGASKEVQVKELESLAAEGFLAVGIDNVGHGERRFTDDSRFSKSNPDFNKNFFQAVLETALEVPQLLDTLVARSLAYEGKIGALGISMGGYIVYKAVTLEPRLQTAVAVVASPEWTPDTPESPHRNPERFSRVRLLSQTAGRDEVVPSRYARAFHERLKGTYSDYDARFAYLEYPKSDHLLEADWTRLWAATLEWFGRQLNPVPELRWPA